MNRLALHCTATFKDARAKISKFDFFLKISPLKNDELVMSEI